MRSILAIVLLASCYTNNHPIRFLPLVGPGTSPWTGEMGCISTSENANVTGCTSWDGHHVLHVGSDPDRGWYSELGPTWGTTGRWHPITEAQADQWWEDRVHIIPERPR